MQSASCSLTDAAEHTVAGSSAGTGQSFDRAGGVALPPGAYERFRELFVLARQWQAGSSSDGREEHKVVGELPHGLITSLCCDLVALKDDAEEAQRLSIMCAWLQSRTVSAAVCRERIDEIGVLLELNTRLAASLFSKIGELEHEVGSAFARRLCQEMCAMAQELQSASDEDARATSLRIAEEYLARSNRADLVLMPIQRAQEAMIWDAPAVPDAAIHSGFAAPNKGSCRVLRDGFATDTECSELVGLAIVSMVGCHHRGGHCSIGCSTSELDLALDGLRVSDQLCPQRALLNTVKERAIRTMEIDHGLAENSLVDSGGAMLVRIQGPDCAAQSGPLELDTTRQYWDVHCDKAEISSWDYSGVLYLSTAEEHFHGGKFVFVDSDANRVISPVVGRLVTFASGFENIHHMQPVSGGVRFALVLFFSLNTL